MWRAQMTDLLQTAVNTGTGRAAQIGRPVAGKTGTTSSNKDGWFVGFSSGLTTGVWMGRDDAKAIPGLQGGRAPAQAFAAFMRVAVAKRPAEAFDTEVTLPEWQLEPDDEAYFGSPDESFVDENGIGRRPTSRRRRRAGDAGRGRAGGGAAGYPGARAARRAMAGRRAGRPRPNNTPPSPGRREPIAGLCRPSQ